MDRKVWYDKTEADFQRKATEMSRVEELIQELCPDGVEYKKLGEFAEILIGEFVHKNKQSENGKYSVYNGGITNTGYYDEYNRPSNRIIISARGANAGFINRVFEPFWSGNSCYTIDLNTKEVDWIFLYYWLKANEKNLVAQQQLGGIPAISKKQIMRMKIPVPPLEVQREIVRILDNFTELTAELIAELTAEFTARKQQYEYYRDQLLTFDGQGGQKSKLEEMLQELCPDGVEYRPIKNCVLKTDTIRWKDHLGETYKYIDLSSVDRCTQSISDTMEINCENAPSRAQQVVQTGDILFGTTRPTLKRYCMIPKEYNGDICSTGFCVLRADNKTIIQRWLFHIISSTDFFDYVENHQRGASYPSISDSEVKEFKIPVPPLEVQREIVRILDNFNAICSDLTSGLPAEIEARQKQYEYYRDKLLTFKEKSA